MRRLDVHNVRIRIKPLSLSTCLARKRRTGADVHNDVLAVSDETLSTSEPVKEDMGSASGNTASLGGRAGQGKIRLCAFTSNAKIQDIFITDSGTVLEDR